MKYHKTIPIKKLKEELQKFGYIHFPNRDTTTFYQYWAHSSDEHGKKYPVLLIPKNLFLKEKEYETYISIVKNLT